MTNLPEWFEEHDDDKVKTRVVDSVEPECADDWPPELDGAVRKVLIDSGVGQPYRHQFESIKHSLRGADVVLESPTASGKTIAFLAPMLHELIRNPGGHALMVYPTKALGFDQRTQIRPLCEPLRVHSWFVDGDQNRMAIETMKSSPVPILITNPEYLNMSFLGWKEQWQRFLGKLRYVVIDEMHEYRGFFGGNMALLLRRFFLHLNRIGVSPRLFLSTATCENPQEHAQNLTGKRVKVVSARGVLRPRRHFIFVNPGIPDFRYRDSLQRRVERDALAVMSKGLQVLVFCPTKKFLEDAYRRCRTGAEKLKLNPEKISPFHADLNPAARQGILQRIKNGDINIVFTTNALELGLDIGGLDGVILAGFPPSIMSAWQQIGRAGRSWDSDAFVLFYAMNDPIDRFFVGNLDAFLNKPFDELVVDPANEELIKRHLPSLVEEANGQVNPSEEAILGSPFYSAYQNNTGTIPSGFQPQFYLDIQGGIGKSFKVRRGSEELGQISEMRRFREAYIGGILPFFGHRYRVHSHEENAVILEETEQYLRTEPGFYATVKENKIFDGIAYGDIEAYYGSLSIGTIFTGYKLVDERSGEIIRTSGDNAALFQDDRHSFRLNVPQSQTVNDGLGAVEQMIRVGAMFAIPMDRFDTSTYSTLSDSKPSAYCYENYPYGIGVAKKLFSVWDTALAKGVEVARNCRCASGCQNCIEPAKSWDISNTRIDKGKGIELAEELFAAVRNGPTRKWQNGMMVPVG